MIGEILNKSTPSAYQPNQDVKDFTKAVQQDYQTGVDILEKSYIELNDRSVTEDENRGQMMFNAFVDTSVEDPNEAWKWRGTRSMARNKGVAMHAQLTSNYILPLFVAQNDDDEVDRDFSDMMRYVIEWMASPTNSNYQSSFLQIVFAMITNPVTYLGAEYCEVYQTVKERQENGEVSTKQIIDEVLSGYQAPIWSSNQVLITNAYERNIQKQRRIIKRRWVEKTELDAKYENHPNWQYVKEGQISIYDDSTDKFYDVTDDDHKTLVAEDTVMTRRDDSEVCFVGGVYVGADNIDDNMMKHRDNRGAPKYDIVPFGYNRIGEHFFFYKSMMNAVGWDNMLYDTMSEMTMNRAMLELDAPIAITGVDSVDSEVIFPSSVVTFENENAKVTKLLPNSDMNAGFGALRETEKSINDATLNETSSGQLPDKDQKAYSVAQAQASAQKLIRGTMKTLAESLCWYGDLMKDIGINHIMTPKVMSGLLGESDSLKYRTLSLTDKVTNGSVMNKHIKFDPNLLGLELTKAEKDEMEMQHLEDIEYPYNKSSFIYANPEVAANFKYLAKVDLEEMFVKNQEYWQPVLLNLKTALAQDPYTDQEKLTSELMYAHFRSRGKEFTKKPAQAALPGGSGPNPLGNMVQNKALSTVSNGAQLNG